MKCAILILALLLAVQVPAAEVSLSRLDLTMVRQGWGAAQAGQSVTEKTLRIGDRDFADGVGTHAVSAWHIALDGKAEKFEAFVGVDTAAANEKASIEFWVIGDNRELWHSGVCKLGEAARHCQVPLAGVKQLTLFVTDAGDGVEAKITFAGAPPKSVPAPVEQAAILTPKPGPAPRINGPTVYGCRPGSPFLYRIPCTGQRPMQFAVIDLPAGLMCDAATGIITGTVSERGEYRLTLRAENQHGTSQRPFKIVAGDTLSLTPQMGFNDWYAYYNRVTAADMRFAADAMINSGMADAGYQYVNIDDCWMGARDKDGKIQGNEKFPDMKALADYIHSKGLKAGLYTSPGPKTCAGYTGAYQHEALDARQFADWGFDFLKYDWCSYGRVAGGKDLAAMQKPYRLMGDLLKQQKRDIVLNLCQYGMGDVWKWGAEVGGHSWRTGGDLGFELHRIFEVALKNCAIREHNKPGGWNDPDYIQIGWIGNARGMGFSKPAPLTPNESYAFMSLWCLMASPLFYSGDMTRLDDFTLNVLCNPEVIDVDQDPLGQCARVIGKAGLTFVLAKDMEDGSQAVGLCNRGEWDAAVAVSWADLGLTGKQRVRDLWRQKDVGVFEGRFETTVPRRGVTLIRIWKDKAP